MRRPSNERQAPKASTPAGAKVQTASTRATKATQPPKKARAEQAVPPEQTTRPSRAQRNKDSAALEAKRQLKEAVRARKAFERDEQRRFTAHLRRRRITIFSIIGAVVFLALFIGVGVFSPLMSVKSITFSGTHLVNASVIEKELASQLGRPLPLVDTGVIRAALAKQPLIKSYSIQSIPPDTLIVNVVERSPIAYLQTAQGFSLVDPAGVAIEVTPTRAKNYPLLSVAGGSPTAQGFPAAIAVLRALPASVRDQVTEIQAESRDNVVLILNGSGARVVWGSAEQSALKSTVLASLMKHYPASASAVYDVSSPESVVVR